MIINKVMIMWASLTIRALIVTSLVVSVGVAGSCPCSTDGKFVRRAAAHAAANGDCACVQRKGHCCCGDGCQCTEPAPRQDNTAAIASGSFQRIQPWAHAAFNTALSGIRLDIRALTHGPILSVGGELTLVALGMRLNC
jgi:hypothetical protein